jgi:hypothetical protein
VHVNNFEGMELAKAMLKYSSLDKTNSFYLQVKALLFKELYLLLKEMLHE